MSRLVLPHTRAQAEHAADVTARLQAESPLDVDGVNLGLDQGEAICPACSLAFFVSDRAHSWGLCPDCLTALIRS